MEQSSDDAGQPSSSHAHGPASEHSKSQLRAASAGCSRKAVMAAWNMKDIEDRVLQASHTHVNVNTKTRQPHV